jgi:UDP-N-acetyl-D-glucosamine dehydrogenase
MEWQYLLNKIENREIRVGVVGLGYVGLPLAVLAGQKGFQVLGVDQNSDKVAGIQAGFSGIRDISDEDIRPLLAAGQFIVSTKYHRLAECDVIIICVPTPLSAGGVPDYSILHNAVQEIAAVLQPGQLVILESTVAPGTTGKAVLSRLEKNGLKAGRDFCLAYSPERIDPGNPEYRLQNIPKLVAGYTPLCKKLACAIYQALGMPVIPVSNLAVAEMAKLLENTYRDINIAFINEMAQVCRPHNISIWEVIRAAATKPFGYQSFYPGSGVGGHCIPVDSIYYTSWARSGGHPALLAEHARRINLSMPGYVAEIVSLALQDTGKKISGSKILILGVTYKKDTDDIRESPVLPLIEQLTGAGSMVSYHDPTVPSLRVSSGEMKRSELAEAVGEQDCIVLAVAHSEYCPRWLFAQSRLIVDLTNRMEGFPRNRIYTL